MKAGSLSLNCFPQTAEDTTAADGRRSWEGTPPPRLKPWLILGAGLVLAGVVLGTLVRELDDIQQFFMEDGPIESLQACVLMVIAVIFAAGFLRSANGRAFFCLAAAFATVFATTRELPRCGSVFSGDGVCLESGWKSSIVISAGVIAIAALFWRRMDWRKVMALSNLRWVWPCVVVVVMLAGAEFAEHRVHVEIEESLELAGYLYLGAFASWVLMHTRRLPADRSPPQGADLR